MKKAIAIFLMLTLFILTGCNSGAGEEKERTVDTVRSFNHYYKTIIAAETEDTIYFIGKLQYFIKYVDKATGIAGPLCGKPECKHDGKDCNAYTSYMGAECIFVDSGRLYWLGYADELGDSDRILYSEALDGTDRREVARYDGELFKSQGGSYAYFVPHGEYLYYGVVKQIIEEGEETYYNYVCALPIDTDKEVIEILNEKTMRNHNLAIQFYGNSLYITTNDNAAGPEGEKGKLFDFRLRRWDAGTREIETLYEDLNSPYFWTMEMWVTDESVYFDRNGYTMIYRYDFDTGECGEVFRHDVANFGIWIADNMVTGFKLENKGGGSYGLSVEIRDFEGNILVADTYQLDLQCPNYGSTTTHVLGRDEQYAYYGFAVSAHSGDKFNHTDIVKVALDGSGAEVMCETTEKLK